MQKKWNHDLGMDGDWDVAAFLLSRGLGVQDGIKFFYEWRVGNVEEMGSSLGDEAIFMLPQGLIVPGGGCRGNGIEFWGWKGIGMKQLACYQGG